MMADLTERTEDALDWYARKLMAIGELHAPLRIYDECGHDHPEDDPARVDCHDFASCEEAFLYVTCRHCCAGQIWGDQTEECASEHDHGPDRPRCPTAAILDGDDDE